MEIDQLVTDLASAIHTADARAPRAKQYQPGIGPHTEDETIALAVEELCVRNPELYADKVRRLVPYPETPRQRCDLCLGEPPDWEWAIEVKLLRFLGDTGKPNDNMLMHILSPYSAHRSALTDCDKLAASSLGRRKGIVIYGYDHENWPLEPAIEAFERLASVRAHLGPRQTATFEGLIHPVHSHGRVFGWELRVPNRHGDLPHPDCD